MLKPTWFHVLCVLLIPFLDWKKLNPNSVCYVQIGEITMCVGENIHVATENASVFIKSQWFPIHVPQEGAR